MRARGLEPLSLAAPEPKPGAYAIPPSAQILPGASPGLRSFLRAASAGRSLLSSSALFPSCPRRYARHARFARVIFAGSPAIHHPRCTDIARPLGEPRAPEPVPSTEPKAGPHPRRGWPRARLGRNGDGSIWPCVARRARRMRGGIHPEGGSDFFLGSEFGFFCPCDQMLDLDSTVKRLSATRLDKVLPVPDR